MVSSSTSASEALAVIPTAASSAAFSATVLVAESESVGADAVATGHYARVADGKLYATREDGVVIVAEVESEFKVLSENAMGERMIASPVPVDGRLLLRGEQHLFCVAAPKER